MRKGLIKWSVLMAMLTDTSLSAGPIPVTLEIYRHGNSCSNIVQGCTKDAQCRAIDNLMQDSIVSDYGVKAARTTANANIPKPDVVFTSPLLRAIETGLYQFPGKTVVYPAPYLKESSSVPPSLPLATSQQKQILIKMDGTSAAARTNFQYTTNEACTASSTSPRCTANWDKFLQWLGTTLSTNAPKEISSKIAAGQPINIAVVTHGMVIQDQIIKRDGASNNKGYTAQFSLDPTTKKLTQTSTTWQDITFAQGVPGPCEGGRTVTPSDWARCQKQYPVAWGKLVTNSCFI